MDYKGGIRMNLHALRIFNDVSRTGSITRSAQNLLLSQPAVTAQIRNLERELGLKLVEARGRNIGLTEAGELLAQHSQRLFAMEAEIEGVMAAMKSGLLGSLKICATELPERTLLHRWITGYKLEHPEVAIQLLKGQARSALQRLLDEQVHISIVCGNCPIEDEAVDYFTILEDELIFAVPDSHRLAGREVTLDELVKEPFVMREEGSYTRDQLLTLFRSTGYDQPRCAILIEGLKETAEAVISGFGIALLPALFVKKELASGQLKRIHVKGVKLPHPIRVCTRKHGTESPVIRSFISFIQSDIRTAGQTIEG
ncbi:LysR family transcriptional regulator [Paenibacillus lactis]